jgi:hypothetical protein
MGIVGVAGGGVGTALLLYILLALLLIVLFAYKMAQGAARRSPSGHALRRRSRGEPSRREAVIREEEDLEEDLLEPDVGSPWNRAPEGDLGRPLQEGPGVETPVPSVRTEEIPEGAEEGGRGREESPTTALLRELEEVFPEDGEPRKSVEPGEPEEGGEDLESLEIPGGSPLVGRSLQEIDLEALSGAEIVSFLREDKTLPLQEKIQLRAGDRIVIRGRREAIERAREVLEKKERYFRVLADLEEKEREGEFRGIEDLPGRRGG